MAPRPPLQLYQPAQPLCSRAACAPSGRAPGTFSTTAAASGRRRREVAARHLLLARLERAAGGAGDRRRLPRTHRAGSPSTSPGTASPTQRRRAAAGAAAARAARAGAPNRASAASPSSSSSSSSSSSRRPCRRRRSAGARLLGWQRGGRCCRGRRSCARRRDVGVVRLELAVPCSRSKCCSRCSESRPSTAISSAVSQRATALELHWYRCGPVPPKEPRAPPCVRASQIFSIESPPPRAWRRVLVVGRCGSSSHATRAVELDAQFPGEAPLAWALPRPAGGLHRLGVLTS